MLNRFEDELKIFDDFVIDKSLPKHQVKKETVELESGESPFTGNFTGGADFTVTVNEDWSDGDTTDISDSSKKHNSKCTELWDKLLRKIGVRKRVISVKEFFHHVKNTAEEITLIDKRIKGYKAALQSAAAAGQTSLAETIRDDIEVVKVIDGDDEVEKYVVSFD